VVPFDGAALASLAITRSSCPRAASSGGGTWLSGQVGAADVQVADQAGDHLPGVRQ
jgi:hypothetical protein